MSDRNPIPNLTQADAGSPKESKMLSIDEIAASLGGGKKAVQKDVHEAPISGVAEGSSVAPASRESSVVHVEVSPDAPASPKKHPIETMLEIKDGTASTPAEPSPEKKPEKRDPQSARFAALSRKEKEMRARAAEIESRAAAIESQLKKAEEREVAIAEREERIKRTGRPLDILKEFGYSYTDATQDVLGNYTPKERDPVDAKLDERLGPVSQNVDELKGVLAQIQESMAELQQQRVRQAEMEVSSAIKDTARETGCEYIQHVGDEAYSLVRDVIAEYYQKNKRILNYEAACARVERYYEDRFETLAKAPKASTRMAAPAAPKLESTKIPAKEPTTLTQAHSSGAPRAKPDLDKLNRSDALSYLASTIRYIE